MVTEVYETTCREIPNVICRTQVEWCSFQSPNLSFIVTSYLTSANSVSDLACFPSAEQKKIKILQGSCERNESIKLTNSNSLTAYIQKAKFFFSPWDPSLEVLPAIKQRFIVSNAKGSVNNWSSVVIVF